MSFANYDALVDAIADFLNRDDLEPAIPDFIRLAEARMQRVLRDYTTRSTDFALPLSATTGLTTPLPGLPGVVEVETVGLRVLDAALTFNPPRPLDRITEAEWQRLHAERPATGRPTKYAIHGQTLAVYPFPDVPRDSTGAASSYVLLLTMIGPSALFAVPLTVANFGSNPIVANHPDLYLYGSLVETAPYLEHDERLPVWESRFQQAVREVNALHDRLAHLSGGPTRPALPVVFG